MPGEPARADPVSGRSRRGWSDYRRAVVRRAVRGDLDELLSLIRAFYALDHHEYDEYRVAAALDPLLVGDDWGQVWVLDGPSGLTGYAIVTWSYSLESGGRDCILDEVYVVDSGQGQGSLLLTRALDEARAWGAAAVFLEVEAHNRGVLPFYAGHGFVVEDSVWMSRSL